MKQLERGKLKFVQYTSAEAAVSIIRSEQIWLRNSQCMKDYSEIQHGVDCLIAAYRSDDPRNKFRSLLEKIFPRLPKKFEDLFDGWIPHFESDTYIACLSQHLTTEDQYGRLSMWRAYGGSQPVAIVINTDKLVSDTPTVIKNAHICPVSYLSPEDFNEELFSVSDRIEKHIEFISEFEEDVVLGLVFELFRSYAVSLKHPGFAEEREWRIFYMPTFKTSELVKIEIESINGVPQEVCKIPLKEFPEEGLTGASIPRFIHKIIIGPSEYQSILIKSFTKLLETAGCTDAYKMVCASGIPLRP